MKENIIKKVYNKLFFRIYLYYAIMLTFFAILLGIIYLNLYKQDLMDNYTKQLQIKAESISSILTECVKTEDNESFTSYIEVLDVIETSDVWIISNPESNNPMKKVMQENVNLVDVEIMNEQQKVLDKAFDGEINHSTGYFDIYGKVMVSVGVPIYGSAREVVGAVLLNAFIDTQTKNFATSRYLIGLSTVVALLISFIIAILFARKLSVPISKMRSTALSLAEGNYNNKTGIVLKSEIGDLANAIDILADKLLENENERKNLEQMRLDFFANVSHELRTPITVVRAYTEMLCDGVVTDESKIAGYYERMLLECKSMERLVGDLLILSKMQNPDFIVDVEPVNIAQIFDDVIRSANTISQSKNVSIKIEKDQDTYMILGDYDRLRQMFFVILDNAIKFSNEYSTIYIKLSTSDKIRISIRDEGIGISKEDLPNIFDKFYKSKLRTNANGTGLGLAIAKQIAFKHQATIEVVSEVSVGTEFIFTFHKMDGVGI